MSARRRPVGTPPHPLIAELRQERIAAGLSQRRVPGVPQGKICAWETGRAMPTLEGLVAYAAALGYYVILEDEAGETVAPGD